jgi:hypothetical protein
MPEEISNKIAFAEVAQELAKCGILFLHNFWCCQGCGTYALGDHKHHTGYVFYHNQDLERWTEGSIHFSWGSFCKEPYDKFDVQLGKLIVSRLEKYFNVEWDESVYTRIVIKEK